MINGRFPCRLGLAEKPVATDEQLQDLKGDHQIFFGQVQVVFLYDLPENTFKHFLLGI
jgi:hypothetical protein